MEALEKNITELSGFKISNSHFRIGSKIHISDFYYAKRFFQNGFFSSRIAYLLANDIIRYIERVNKVDEIKNNGLTIIGYEMYSELLISLIDKFLRKKWNLTEKKLNHNLYEDVENLRLSKKINFLGNVVIVVPIASTFSTSIKIESQLLKDVQLTDNKMLNIIRPHLNVLYVSDGTPKNEITEIEKSFSWKKKDIENKTIIVEAIYSEETETDRAQKYYLTLPTTWHNVDECKLCNPTKLDKGETVEDLEAELPLYETDRTAVTPAIIFDYPKGRVISESDLNRKVFFDTETVIYGHHVRGNGHFLYSVNTELFLEKNKSSIQEWLIEIKNSIEFKNSYKETDRVIIISSCHFSNAAFITLVNDYLFSSSANIIHYDPSNDYVQNFKIVYGQEINDADKIFFVDDSLKSGSAFDKIYQFLQNTLDLTKEDLDKGISGCFFLLNKSQPFTFNNLRNKLIKEKHVFSFANLHIHTSLRPDEKSPLELEETRYNELKENSFLESLQVHFYKQADKVSIKETKSKILVSPKSSKAKRHLDMFFATHRIYQYFTIENEPKLNSFYDFINDLFFKTDSPIEKTKLSSYRIQNLNEDETKAYLKVLTQTPFTQYKPLKDYVFKWTIQLLLKHIKDVDIAIKKEEFSNELFDTLKFLMRRVGLLNSNILISDTLINFLPLLYSENGIPKVIAGLNLQIEENKKSPLFEQIVIDLEEAISKLKDFHIFYTAQIKELLLKSESRCLRLESMLNSISKETNPYIKQIVRILKEENSLIIKRFYEHISNHSDWKKIYADKSNSATDKSIIYPNDKIVEFLKRTSVSRHHKFQILESFFSTTGQPNVISNKNLLNFLWLQYFLSTDKDKKISLNVKTELIMKKLMQMFFDSGITTPGAFFKVNDSRKTSFIAFNKNFKGIVEIDYERLRGDKFIDRFFKGENNSFKKEQVYKHSKTIIELQRNKEGKWIDLFATSESVEVSGLSEDLIPEECNRLVLVRLNKRLPEKSTDKTQGILGFYYKFESNEIVDINIFRYLLLLRPLLSKFIEQHHENDEFRDWQIAEIKQKTSLLTGHGREMLMMVANHHRGIYIDIVSTLLITQRFLIDKKEEDENKSVYKVPKIKKMFASFYLDDKERTQITNSFFEEIRDMAKDIYAFAEIENPDPIDIPQLDIHGNISFKFHTEILRMICFELVVNAKKNRWLFAGEKVTDLTGNLLQRNKVWIEAKQENEKLIVKISNTGPTISNSDFKKIQRKKSIKRYDSSSGIELIDTILTEFYLGEIDFLLPEMIATDISKFTVILTLNQNPDGE